MFHIINKIKVFVDKRIGWGLKGEGKEKTHPQ